MVSTVFGEAIELQRHEGFKPIIKNKDISLSRKHPSVYSLSKPPQSCTRGRRGLLESIPAGMGGRQGTHREGNIESFKVRHTEARLPLHCNDYRTFSFSAAVEFPLCCGLQCDQLRSTQVEIRSITGSITTL